MADEHAEAEARVPHFKFESLLNQGSSSLIIAYSCTQECFDSITDLSRPRWPPRRTQGTINDQPAVLVLERAPFPSLESYVSAIQSDLYNVEESWGQRCL